MMELKCPPDQFACIFSYFSKHHKDLTIVSKDNHCLQTSSLLLTMTSNYIKPTLHQLLFNSFGISTLYLKDFTHSVLQIFIQFISTGVAKCSTQSQFQELNELIQLLDIKWVKNNQNNGEIVKRRKLNTKRISKRRRRRMKIHPILKRKMMMMTVSPKIGNKMKLRRKGPKDPKLITNVIFVEKSLILRDLILTILKLNIPRKGHFLVICVGKD